MTDSSPDFAAELAELRRMARTFQGFSDRAEALRASVDPAAEKYHDE